MGIFLDNCICACAWSDKNRMIIIFFSLLFIDQPFRLNGCNNLIVLELELRMPRKLLFEPCIYYFPTEINLWILCSKCCRTFSTLELMISLGMTFSINSLSRNTCSLARINFKFNSNSPGTFSWSFYGTKVLWKGQYLARLFDSRDAIVCPKAT